MFFFTVLLIAASFPAVAAAQQAPDVPLPTLPGTACCGMLIDHTITVAGHEFFRLFASQWREQTLNERYTITVHEQPSARRGTQVWIEYDRERMFEAYLPASRAKLPALAREANEICYRNVVDTEVRQLLFRESDLAPNEI